MLLDVRSAAFRDQIYGCWMGKNCGGTLGAPLERALGEPEPFDVWWYPELQPGGIPNDDLEMQLIWLKALEEVGPRLDAQDLAQYWLDHIGYNWDEYGLSKTNLRLGLLPPVSGAYNNWFRDCMGCPIRSEIWACVAPGVPRVAVKYAYQDAICDHAGGESVYGELFNTAVESAAFVVSDRDELIKIGLSYVPPDSKTAIAINAAVDAYAEGLDWKAARRRVLQATPHHVAQYSPINLAFQVVGWLYGDDFGDAICKAVNCGYDTDCTGATLGSYLGIIATRHGLPERWTAPLGETIATNESWGGIRNASNGPNPVPTTLDELTGRICRAAERVLTEHGLLDGSTLNIDRADLYADDSVRELWSAAPMRLDRTLDAVEVSVDYGAGPVLVAGTRRTLPIRLTNRHPVELELRAAISGPNGWTLDLAPRSLTLPPYGEAQLECSVLAPAPELLDNRNLLQLQLNAVGRPAEPALPIALVGARRLRSAGPFTAAGASEADLFAAEFEPEREGRPGSWSEGYAIDNALPIGEMAPASALYLQTYLHSPQAIEAWIGASASCPVKLWVNGAPAVEDFAHRPIRPSYSGNAESYATVQLAGGWNELLLKFVRGADAPAPEAHLLVSSADTLHDGLDGLLWTRLPQDGREVDQ